MYFTAKDLLFPAIFSTSDDHPLLLKTNAKKSFGFLYLFIITGYCFYIMMVKPTIRSAGNVPLLNYLIGGLIFFLPAGVTSLVYP